MLAKRLWVVHSLLRRPLGRSLWSGYLRPRVICRLDGMRSDDRPYQPRKALLELRAARDVVHLHTVAFTANQASLAKDLEVL